MKKEKLLTKFHSGIKEKLPAEVAKLVAELEFHGVIADIYPDGEGRYCVNINTQFKNFGFFADNFDEIAARLNKIVPQIEREMPFPPNVEKESELHL